MISASMTMRRMASRGQHVAAGFGNKVSPETCAPGRAIKAALTAPTTGDTLLQDVTGSFFTIFLKGGL